MKSKDHLIVVSRSNLQLKFRKGDYFPGSYVVGKFQDENLRGNFQEQLNIKLGGLKFYMWKMVGITLEKQFMKLLMVSWGRKLRLQLGILMRKLYV